MFPMTPVQSWALLLLVAALVVGLVWLLLQFMGWLDSRLAADSAELEHAEHPTAPEIYDWAVDGL